jgi:hypothetical protein
MAFVISANKSQIGASLGILGFYDESGKTNSKSLVVEFDSFLNPDAPQYDISDSHVSFNFHNVIAVAAANSSKGDIIFNNSGSVVTWIEYNSSTKQLEVRCSYNRSRPENALLSHTVDLFDVVEENNWVGFSSSTGSSPGYYII